MNLEKLEENRFLRIALIFGVVLLAHVNFLFPEKPENPDSNFIYPFLSSLGSVSEYFEALRNFQTIDVQPVRDLTLLVDLQILKFFGLNVTIFLNVLLWAGACAVGLSILDRFVSAGNRRANLLLVLAFSVYPLFLMSINWGVARKHLLAFLFILLATRAFLTWLSAGTGRSKVVIYYALSVLSVPISIAWPFWCVCYLFLRDRARLKNAHFLVGLFIVMGCTLATNLAYYAYSPTYLELYPVREYDLTILVILFNVGFQFWKLVWPYELSFNYVIGLEGLYGLALLGVALLALAIRYKRDPSSWVWLLFSAAHVAAVARNPVTYYDTYMLASSFGMLATLGHLLATAKPRLTYVLFPLIIIWGAFTFANNRIWESPETLASKSFASQRICPNAIALGFAKYTSGKKLDNDTYNFIQENTCLERDAGDSAMNELKKLVFEATSLYFEDEVDPSYRESRLLELGEKHIYAMLVYLTYLGRENRPDEIEDRFRSLNLSLPEARIHLSRESIGYTVLFPYCKDKELQECLDFFDKKIKAI